jgi:hypothetical protein
LPRINSPFTANDVWDRSPCPTDFTTSHKQKYPAIGLTIVLALLMPGDAQAQQREF